MTSRTPGTYANLVNDAHPAIAGFGGMFLMMLFLDWLFEDRDITWLSWLERPLARIGKLDQLSVIIALAALTAAASAFADEEHFGQVMISGVLGVVTYLLVNGLGNLFEGRAATTRTTTRRSARSSPRSRRPPPPRRPGAPARARPRWPPARPACSCSSTSRCWTRRSPSTA